MRALLLAVALVVPATLFAQDPNPAPRPVVQRPVAAPQAQPPAGVHRFGWVIEGGVEYGGDVLVTLLFDDGSESDLLAGQGGGVAFGFDYRPRSLSQVGIRTTAGIKFTSNPSENADISFIRFPIEVVGSYYLPRDWRVGAGLAYHTGVSFNGDGFVPDVDFDPATGLTVELGWKAIALTYTTMEYSAGGPGLDASAIGVSLSWVFGKKY